jgi:probable F420-dependent oxidoreductase
MAHNRKFRFGVQVAEAASNDAWVALARQAEDLGYSTLFMPDHFGAQLSPFPALAAAAAATTDLKVGALVMCNDYRHPVVHAKEMATLDVLSDGRSEWGIGAGWMNTDYEQSGIPHDTAGVRISRMEEAVTVMKGLFAEGATDHQGEHYQITGLDGQPKPVQRPHPPLLIGGGGRRVLTIAGREADIVGLAPAARTGAVDTTSARDAAADRTEQKLVWIKEAAGDRFDDIELNVLVFAAIVTDDRAGTAEMIGGAFGLSADDALEIPHALIGSVDEICADLEQRRERWGISYVVVQGQALEAMAPVVARLAGT